MDTISQSQGCMQASRTVIRPAALNSILLTLVSFRHPQAFQEDGLELKSCDVKG